MSTNCFGRVFDRVFKLSFYQKFEKKGVLKNFKKFKVIKELEKFKNPKKFNKFGKFKKLKISKFEFCKIISKFDILKL